MKKRACISPCSGVEQPKKYTLFWNQEIMENYALYCIVLYCIVLYCIVLYCIVLYCIVLETKTIFMLYLFNQMILPFHFSSTMSVQNSFKFSITAITLSMDYLRMDGKQYASKVRNKALDDFDWLSQWLE